MSSSFSRESEHPPPIKNEIRNNSLSEVQAHPWKFPIFFPPLDVSPLYSHITNSQMFLWVTDDLRLPWKGHTLCNTLYNTSVGILPVCSGRKQWSLCWSEINQERRHEQQKEKKKKKKEEKKDLRTRGRQSSQTTALKRGGACGMKGGNTVVSLRRRGKLLDGLTSVCTAEVADAPQSGGKAGGELPDDRTITSWVEEKDKRTHADHVTHDHWWFWSGHGQQAPARCHGSLGSSDLRRTMAVFLFWSEAGRKAANTVQGSADLWVKRWTGALSQTSARVSLVLLQRLLIVCVANINHSVFFLESTIWICLLLFNQTLLRCKDLPARLCSFSW